MDSAINTARVAENKPVYGFLVGPLGGLQTIMGTYEEYDSLRIFLPAFGHLDIIFLFHLRIDGVEWPWATPKVGLSRRWRWRAYRLHMKIYLYMWVRWTSHVAPNIPPPLAASSSGTLHIEDVLCDGGLKIEGGPRGNTNRNYIRLNCLHLTTV